MMRTFYFLIITIISLLLMGCRGERVIKSQNPPSVETSDIDSDFYYSVLLYTDIRKNSVSVGTKAPTPGNYLIAIPAPIDEVKNTVSDALKTTRFVNADWEHGTLTNNQPYTASNALFWSYRWIRTNPKYRDSLIAQLQEQTNREYQIGVLKEPMLSFDSLYLAFNGYEKKVLPNDIDLWTIKSVSSESPVDFIDSSITLIDATSFFPEKKTPITVMVLKSRGKEVYGSYLKWKECGAVFCQWKISPRRMIRYRINNLLEASLFDIGEMVRLKYSALPASMLRDFLPSEDEYIIQKEKRVTTEISDE